MAEEPRPPASDRNISSTASILRTPHGTPNLIPFLLSRVAQHRGSIALPSITLEPHNLIRPIEMSDMDPRVEGTEAQSSEVTEDEIL
ncbi:hypothetical protein H0H93_004698 [Arthromyces matolae]|nr:hypothetical protein H0H93_004698 [Arthromyces matolae]